MDIQVQACGRNKLAEELGLPMPSAAQPALLHALIENYTRSQQQQQQQQQLSHSQPVRRTASHGYSNLCIICSGLDATCAHLLLTLVVPVNFLFLLMLPFSFRSLFLPHTVTLLRWENRQLQRQMATQSRRTGAVFLPLALHLQALDTATHPLFLWVRHRK